MNVFAAAFCYCKCY